MDAAKIQISVQTRFLQTETRAAASRFVFGYQITIENHSDAVCQLLSRHWVIQDANGKIEEVYGEGVVGKQPVIRPGERHQYESRAVLETEHGTMQGRFFMIWKPILGSEAGSDAIEFEAPIEPFLLSVPRVLH